MQREDKTTSHLFGYMSGSLPPWKWLWTMLLAISAAVIVFLGVGAGNDLFYTFVLGKSHSGEFLVDPILSEYGPNKLPLFFKIVSDIYDIPFYHLLFGILFKGLVLVAYFFLAWKMTRSSFASMISVLMIFGLLKFEIGAETILNLKLPFIPDSMEFRRWGYLSFRQASAPFIIIGTIFFLSRKFVFSSIFLALSVYCHPHNGIIFFASLNLTLFFCIIFWKNRLSVFVDWIKFAFPFLFVIFPYLLSALTTFRDVEPLPFNVFWELSVKNEAGDVSTLFTLNNMHPPYLLSFYLTLVALFLHFLFKSNVPKIKLNIKNLIRDDRDMLWPMMLAPWALVAFGCLWELGLMTYLPNFLNDLIAPLHIRRVSMVSIILYIPIFGILLARIIFVLSEKLGWEVLGGDFLGNFKARLAKKNLASIDNIFAVGLSMGALLFVLLLKNEKIETFKNYWVFEPLGFEHAIEKDAIFSFKNKNRAITFSSFIDVCKWIKGNTPTSAAFFNPGYIRPFRTCTKRQGFLEEKVDGNVALTDRKFTTIYIERFMDIHRGLTYNDLPGKYVVAAALYSKMRERFLSLGEGDIEFLKEKYPGYRYLLTETGHRLQYPVIYRNMFFILYDLSSDSRN